MLNGSITMGLRHSNTEDDYYSIELVDELSRTHFLQIRMTPTDFAYVLSNRGHIPCQFELHPQLVGKQREHKTVTLPCDPWKLTEQERQALMETYEVEGWQGRKEDLENRHKWGNGGIVVVFERWVDVPDNS